MKRLILFASAVLLTRGLYVLCTDLQRRGKVEEQVKDLQTWEGEGGTPDEVPVGGVATQH